VSHGIDLVRPDDGYSSIRRRAARSPPFANGQKKNLQTASPLAVAHPQTSPGVQVGPSRNAVGVSMPSDTGVGKPAPTRPIPALPITTGLAKNSVGISVSQIRRPETHLSATGAMIPNTGINGTTMGHVGAGAGRVGGPAKDRSAINGSVVRHKF